MLKMKIFVFILLASLILSFYPAGAQIVHENPDRIPARDAYDADRRLATALEEMFGSLNSFMAHINASDFEASREDIALFAMSYANFTEAYRRAGNTWSGMDAIAEKLASMPGDLLATVNSSEAYSAGLEQFLEYTAAGDTAGATRAAAGMQASYADISKSLSKFSANSTGILRMLSNSSVDTTGLEKGIAGIMSYAAKMSECNQKPLSLLGNASLTLVAGSREAIAGGRVALTATLAVPGKVPAGRLIRFYVDGEHAGSAITDAAGVCTIAYRVDGGSFRRTMLARAELDPQGEGLYPAASNVVEIARRTEPAFLTVYAAPGAVSCADTVYVYGTLTTQYGVPAAGQTVTVLVAGTPAGNATTRADGSYSLQLAVRHDMPAGECAVQSSFESAPDCSLASALSSPSIIRITPLASRVTLDQPQAACRGCETASFSGTLEMADGRPVAGADVGVFADGVLLGTGRTDAGGRFRLDARVPYDIAPGVRGVYASFDPGEGRALARSQSEAFDVRFEPAPMRANLRGVPLVAFPGDGLELAGVLMTGDGQPVGGRQVAVGAPGAATVATTDASGNFNLSLEVAGPGFYLLTITSPGGGLLSALDSRAGIMLVMPFDRTGTALAFILLLPAAGAAFIIMTRRRASGRGKPLPRPTVSLTTPRPRRGRAAFGFEEDLNAIGQAITAENDRREAVRSIYATAKRMLRDRYPTLPESITHRELCRMLSDRQPSLSAPLKFIATSYEGVIFGHHPPADEDIYGSLYNLGELHKMLYGNGGSP